MNFNFEPPTFNPFENIQKDFIDSMQKNIDIVDKSRKEKADLDEKRHRELVGIATEQLNQLKNVNMKLSEKLDCINTTLDFILNSLGANFQRIERQQLLENKNLAEIITIISEKDKGKLKRFIEKHGIDSIAILLEALSFLAGS